MDPPTGKALHYGDIKLDLTGPAGIHFHPQRQFTAEHLPQYHPHSDSLSPTHKQAIIEAHEVTRVHLEKMRQPPQPQLCAWPFRHRVSDTDNTISFTTSLPSLQSHIAGVPTKTRNFTLHVLARLHPVWKEGLDQLIPLILSTRLLPRTLKICGRTLIPKPGKTERRPISLLNALDSYIDTLVNRNLSSTVEKLNILDESIAAYRPGKSCTDVTLKHITAVEDVHQHHNEFLAQIDEDKAKYSD